MPGGIDGHDQSHFLVVRRVVGADLGSGRGSATGELRAEIRRLMDRPRQRHRTDLSRSGRARSPGSHHLPALSSEGTWTCNGNTFTSIETSSSSTLSADGRTMTGSCCVTTRVGGAAVAAKPAAPGDGAAPRRYPGRNRFPATPSRSRRRPSRAAMTPTSRSRPPARRGRNIRGSPPINTSRPRLRRGASATAKLELTILREAAETPTAK